MRKKQKKANKVGDTLKARGSVYGSFQSNATLTQSLMDTVLSSAERPLAAYEKEALHMVMHKVSRIVCGKLTKKDNWHDIAGYATLAEELTEDQ